jgi:hypothetical protein
MNRLFISLFLLVSFTFSSIAVGGLIEVLATDGTVLRLERGVLIQLAIAGPSVVAAKLRAGDALIYDGQLLIVRAVIEGVLQDAYGAQDGAIDLGIQQRTFIFGLGDSLAAAVPLMEARLQAAQAQLLQGFIAAANLRQVFESNAAAMRSFLDSSPQCSSPSEGDSLKGNASEGDASEEGDSSAHEE